MEGKNAHVISFRGMMIAYRCVVYGLEQWKVCVAPLLSILCLGRRIRRLIETIQSLFERANLGVNFYPKRLKDMTVALEIEILSSIKSLCEFLEAHACDGSTQKLQRVNGLMMAYMERVIKDLPQYPLMSFHGDTAAEDNQYCIRMAQLLDLRLRNVITAPRLTDEMHEEDKTTASVQEIGRASLRGEEDCQDEDPLGGAQDAALRDASSAECENEHVVVQVPEVQSDQEEQEDEGPEPEPEPQPESEAEGSNHSMEHETTQARSEYVLIQVQPRSDHPLIQVVPLKHEDEKLIKFGEWIEKELQEHDQDLILHERNDQSQQQTVKLPEQSKNPSLNDQTKRIQDCFAVLLRALARGADGVSQLKRADVQAIAFCTACYQGEIKRSQQELLDRVGVDQWPAIESQVRHHATTTMDTMFNVRFDRWVQRYGVSREAFERLDRQLAYYQSKMLKILEQPFPTCMLSRVTN